MEFSWIGELIWEYRSNFLEKFIFTCGVTFLSVLTGWHTYKSWRKRTIQKKFSNTFSGYNYPSIPIAKCIEQYWGEKIDDPFRFLEDFTSTETKIWIEEQIKCTSRYFCNLYWTRKLFATKYAEFYGFDKVSAPFQRGSLYFYFRKSGLQNQYVLYKSESVDQVGEVLLDPNRINSDGAATIHGTWFTEDGNMLAYGISYLQSDWFTIQVKNTYSGEELSDVINNCKFTSLVWTYDNEGFFYTCCVTSNSNLNISSKSTTSSNSSSSEFHKIYYHRLGTLQSEDFLIFENVENPNWIYSLQISTNEKYLIVTIYENSNNNNLLYFINISKFNTLLQTYEIGNILKITPTFSHVFECITNQNNVYWFRTNYKAKNFKIFKVKILPSYETIHCNNIFEKLLEDAVDVVLEVQDAILESVNITTNYVLILKYFKNISHELYLCELLDNSDDSEHTPNSSRKNSISGKQSTLTQRKPIPLNTTFCTITGPYTQRTSCEIFFQVHSFTDPGTTYWGVLGHGAEGAVVMLVDILTKNSTNNFKNSELVTKLIKYPSKDGTSIPMLLFGLSRHFQHHQQQQPSLIFNHSKSKGRKSMTPSPCLLYTYGGFNATTTPTFSLSKYLYVSHFQGLLCIACVRGGGDGGPDWHEAAIRQKKQKSVEDLIAAAEFLITSGYTTREQLALQGGSHGGFLVAAAVNARPELFSVAIIQSGVLDMLRYHLFTVGRAWICEYGCAEDSESDFTSLYALSPLHNIGQSSEAYPAMLITTVMGDERVVPLHSFKFVAALQQLIGKRSNQVQPMLIRIDTQLAGHGGSAGKPTLHLIREVADIFAFIAKHTGAKWVD